MACLASADGAMQGWKGSCRRISNAKEVEERAIEFLDHRKFDESNIKMAEGCSST